MRCYGAASPLERVGVQEGNARRYQGERYRFESEGPVVTLWRDSLTEPILQTVDLRKKKILERGILKDSQR
jgi:hypothetical protein